MKFDKDTVIKHHFWFLLGTAMPLALIGILILMTVVSAEIAKNRKDLESALSQAKVAEAKNEKWLQEIGQRVAKAKKREKEVWEQAYNDQKHLFTWPDEVESKFDFRKGLFASEIKADKGAGAPTPVDPKAEEQSVIKHFSGTVQGTQELADAEGNSLGVVVLKVSDGKQTKIIRPTPVMKLTKDGKKINTFVDFDKGDRVAVTYVEGKYFNDPLTAQEQKYFGNAEEGYKTQIAGILEIVQPLKAKGGGVVQLPGWRWTERQGKVVLPDGSNRFLRYVAKEWDLNGDISAEAWMAQEDLWIQRELYRLIRQSNDMISVFDGKGGTDQGKWYTFTNPYWKLELRLNGHKLDRKITNLLPRRQRLGLDFLVTFFEGEEPMKVRIPGEPIEPNEVRDNLPSQEISGKAPTGIYRVEQAIDWETAAVKRIDHISIGTLMEGDCCHSHRTFPEGLKPFIENKGSTAPASDKGPGGPNAPGGGKMPMTGGKGGGLGGTAADAKKTRNGLNPDRYIEQPKPEVRRVPFGLALIIGQEHIDRVLYTFSKSPLRILMTQVIVNRYPQSVRPTGLDQGQDNVGRGVGFGGGLGNFGGAGFGGVRQNIAPATSGGDTQETNVELVIYGIASLYQRYPPRPQGAAGQTAP